MNGWVILVDSEKDFSNAETPHKVITARDYLARPKLFEGARPKIINLSRSYAYQSRGYYASLLAEARGHRIIPSVETMLELRSRTMYEPALPELEDALNRCARKAQHAPGEDFRLLVCFGLCEDERYEAFGRHLFDWFRGPILELSVNAGEWLTIERIRLRTMGKLNEADAEIFRKALDVHTRRDWKSPKPRPTTRYSLAVLHDPHDKMPCSSQASLKHFMRVADRHSVDIELITKKQLHQLAEFDALFIRDTTSIDNHTFRFAQRAVHEGMPVIDDPVSMIRCTNKVFLKELLAAHDVPMPPSVVLNEEEDLEKAAELLNFPIVVKIPDGSFSRGVHKADDFKAFKAVYDKLFEDSDLILAQKFMPTKFDWRIAVLGGEPLFACQYMMARNHWQIIKHGKDGSFSEGQFKTVPIKDAPKDAVETAVRAARAIGEGFYGVDLKETREGIFVMEVNDNPNLDHGVEDQGSKDEVWVRLLDWFAERMV